ncbi:hypothetical protein ACFL6S_27225 [Candidatus Poribacteria bacterium]
MIPTECRFATPSDRDAILRFGERLAAGNVANKLALLALDPALPGENGEVSPAIRRRSLVALDGEEIRATQLFFEHEMYIHGEPNSFIWPAGPISESKMDLKYALFSVVLLKHSLSLQPLHMALGLGSYEHTMARIFVALGWKHDRVPFFFYPVRPYRVLREIKAFDSKYRRIAASLMAYSGMGWLGGFIFCHSRRLRNSTGLCATENMDRFGEWTDETWEKCHSSYGALTRRDKAALNTFYAPGDKRYHRLRVQRNGEYIGWILVTMRDMENDKHFGNLRVGTLVDGLCVPEDAQDVMSAGLRYLIGEKVDICIANWSHIAWRTASRKLGFLQGPSNFIYFVSQAGTPPLLIEDCPLEQIHLSRGDGDGPIHLVPDDL